MAVIFGTYIPGIFNVTIRRQTISVYARFRSVSHVRVFGPRDPVNFQIPYQTKSMCSFCSTMTMCVLKKSHIIDTGFHVCISRI